MRFCLKCFSPAIKDASLKGALADFMLLIILYLRHQPIPTATRCSSATGLDPLAGFN